MSSPRPREDLPPLEFAVTATHTVLEMHIGGEVDVSNTAELEARLVATHIDGQATVRLELGRLAFCDGKGAWLMLQFLQRAERDGCRTTIRGARPASERLLSLLAEGQRPTFD